MIDFDYLDKLVDVNRIIQHSRHWFQCEHRLAGKLLEDIIPLSFIHIKLRHYRLYHGFYMAIEVFVNDVAQLFVVVCDCVTASRVCQIVTGIQLLLVNTIVTKMSHFQILLY